MNLKQGFLKLSNCSHRVPHMCCLGFSLGFFRCNSRLFEFYAPKLDIHRTIDRITGSAFYGIVDSTSYIASDGALNSAVDSAVDSPVGSAVDSASDRARDYALNGA